MNDRDGFVVRKVVQHAVPSSQTSSAYQLRYQIHEKAIRTHQGLAEDGNEVRKRKYCQNSKCSLSSLSECIMEAIS